MKRIGMKALRTALDTHFDRVEADRQELVIVRRGRPDLVVLPRSDLEGLKTTLELLSSPVNAAHLRKSIADLEAGLGQEHDLIEP